MAKDPATLWYWGDWQGGTSTFTRHLKGCYMDLLNAQFNNGHLSLDEIKTVLGSDYGSSWPTLQKKFKEDSQGLFFNERAEFEKNKRIAFTESRKRNLTHKEDQVNNHMAPHMENENRNINTNETKDYIVVEEKTVFDPLPMLEFYEAQLNGMQKEHNNRAWKPLVQVWFKEHLQEYFKDAMHVKNSFKRFYIAGPNKKLKQKIDPYSMKPL